MKYVSFRTSDSPKERFGVLNELSDSVLDVATAHADHAPDWSQRLIDFLRGGDEAIGGVNSILSSGRELNWRPLADLQLLAPLPRPTTIRDCLSFERHWIQCARTVASWKLRPIGWFDRQWESLTGRSFLRPPKIYRERPIYYKGNPNTVVGPEEEIQWPAYSKRLDFELEIAVYIGKQGVDIQQDDAMSHVAGFSLFNDMSARDVQFREMQGRLGPSKSKDFDTGNVLGPFLATPDEVNLESMKLSVRVNGELWSESRAESLQHDVSSTVAFLSRSETLYPGDVIGLGTVPSGCGLELDRWIQPGDEIELAADGLGVLRNRVAAPHH